MANATVTLNNYCNGCKQGLEHEEQILIVKNLKFFHVDCYKKLTERDMIDAQAKVMGEPKVTNEIDNLPDDIKKSDDIPIENVKSGSDSEKLIVNLTPDELWSPRKFAWSKKPFI